MRTIPVRDLKKGMTVYECEAGANIKMVIENDSEFIQNDNAYTAVGITEIGNKIELVQCNGELQYYGPRLYDEPQYYKFIDGTITPNNIEV